MSTLGIENIQHTNGTNAISVGTDGSVTGAFIPEYDIFHQTTNGSNVSSGTYITSNVSRFAGNGFEKIGIGMSFNSGEFSFPSTGKYYVYGKGSMQARGGAVTQAIFRLDVTLNNSSYTEIARGEGACHANDATFPLDCHSLVDVTDVANVKVKFLISTSTNNCRTLGQTNLLRTHFVFMKLGAT